MNTSWSLVASRSSHSHVHQKLTPPPLPLRSNTGLKLPGSDGKISKWPETVGLDGVEAAEYIQKSRPDMKTVTVMGERDIMTRDMRFDRVRIFVDDEGKVVKAPRIG